MTKLSPTTAGQYIPTGVIRQHKTLLYNLLRILDLILVMIAFIVAYYIKNNWDLGKDLSALPDYYYSLFLFLVCYYFSLNVFDVYQSYRNQRLHEIFLEIIKSCLLGTTVAVSLLYFFNEKDISRQLIVLFFVFSLLLLAGSKIILFKALGYFRKNDLNYRNILVIGSRDRAVESIKKILENPATGYNVVGCVELSGRDDLVGLSIFEDVKVIGTMDDYQDILTSHAIDEIIFAVRISLVDKIQHYIRISELLGISTRIIPDFQYQRILYRPETASVYMENFVGMPTISLSSVPLQQTTGLLLKTSIDYLGALGGIILTAPFFLIIGLAVKLTSQGPVFFKQERCGLNGRKFILYKFRTMIENAEDLKKQLEVENEMDGPVFKMKNDPRVTPIGRFLRKTSLDELPQLFNIFKGEMSFVGPRPPIPIEVAQYKLWHRRRLSMKPGLTCIWQISGRNTITFEKWMKLDLEYIDNWSIWLDLKLIFLTSREVLLGHGN